MDAGDMRDKIEILTLFDSSTGYCWSVSDFVWAKAERKEGKNPISPVGVSAKSIRFTIRKREISLHNAIRWEGKHCFLTDIIEIGRLYLAVDAVPAEPVICTVKRRDYTQLNELNRPVVRESTLVFPAVLTEKYLGFTQAEPMAKTEERFVLVAPKAICLKTGEIAVIGEKSYGVQIPHELDEFRNEYEVSRKGDA